MVMIEGFKKDVNNSPKEIQENTGKQVKELNKTIQDLKMEVETIKKSQRETTLEIENLGKKSGEHRKQLKALKEETKNSLKN